LFKKRPASLVFPQTKHLFTAPKNLVEIAMYMRNKEILLMKK